MPDRALAELIASPAELESAFAPMDAANRTDGICARGAAQIIRPPGLRVLPVLLELGKARLSSLVVATAAVGFIVASPAAVAWAQLAWTVLGVGLAALGANALNQWLELAADGRMRRTCGRPLPARRLDRNTGLAFGMLAGAGGPLLLLVFVNGLAAALASATLIIYVSLYTPLKSRTPANTLVGAVVGGLPPLIGWAAATGGLAPASGVLAAILFTWQVPHFLALAWIYREDYARGGFRMLPSVDPDGRLTGLYVVLYSLALLPLTLLPAMLETAGWMYAAGATMLGALFVFLGVRLERERTTAAAWWVFRASVIYLPLLLALLVADRRPAPSVSRGLDLKPGWAQVGEVGGAAALSGQAGQRPVVQDAASELGRAAVEARAGSAPEGSFVRPT
ncbi:MAG: heme o synthase [Planctomycetota bacterium]